MTDAARAEAFRRYDGDCIIDERTGEEVSHDDWGFSEADRAAFVAGAEWQASLPPTDAEVEAAANAMDANFNPDRYPIMAAMFADYARAALTAAREARR